MLKTQHIELFRFDFIFKLISVPTCLIAQDYVQNFFSTLKYFWKLLFIIFFNLQFQLIRNTIFQCYVSMKNLTTVAVIFNSSH